MLPILLRYESSLVSSYDFTILNSLSSLIADEVLAPLLEVPLELSLLFSIIPLENDDERDDHWV